MPPDEEPREEQEGASTPDPPEEEESNKAQEQQQVIDPVGQRAQRERNIENRQYWEAVSTYFNTAQIGTMVVQPGFNPQVSYSGFPGEKSPRITQVIDTEIDLVWAVYQEPINYQEALERLKKNGLIILHGRPKIGKRATAIHLAMDIQSEKIQIHEFPPEVNLSDRIKTELLEKGHFYLIDGILAHKVEGVTSQNWLDFSQQLKQVGTFLIICARQEVRFPADLSPDLRCSLDLPTASASLIIEKHLHHYGDFTLEQIQECLDQEEVSNFLTRSVAPASAGQLAYRLALYLKGECSLEMALRGFAEYAEATVEEWFEESAEDPNEQAFRIALAVFHGAQYSAVEEASRELAARIAPPDNQTHDNEDESKKKSAYSSPLSSKRRRTGRLERARAHTETVYVETEYNVRSEMKIVKLDDPGYQMALLKYLWEEYDDFRDIFLSWLEEQAVNAKSGDIRTRAALAIGALAQLDFLTIRTKIFYPWARKMDRVYRAAIGYALGGLIWDDHRIEDVLGLLRSWSESGEEELRWAAGRAYALVGVRYPGEAMERWWTIFQKMSLRVQLTPNLTFSFLDPEAVPMFQSVIDAVTSLFLAAIEWPGRFHVVYQQLLEDLRHWTERDDDPEANPRLGFPLFLMLMSIRVPGSDKESNNSAEWQPPALLFLADSLEASSSYFTHLTWLLRRGLNETETRDLILNVLHDWVTFADTNRSFESALRQVFQALLSNPDFSKRERGRIEVYLRRWAKHPRQPTPLADELIRDLGLTG